MGKNVVLRDAMARFVHLAECELGKCIPLLCCFNLPLHGLVPVLRDAMAGFVHLAECKLARRMPLICRFPVPLCRLFPVLWNAMAVKIHEAQCELSISIALFRHWFKEAIRSLMVTTIVCFRSILKWTRDRLASNGNDQEQRGGK